MGDKPPTYHEATSMASPRMEGIQIVLMYFSWTDRIRLLGFPDNLQARVTEVLRRSWPKGIQDVRPFDESMEIKLRGNPFAHGGDEEKIAIRRVVLDLLDMFAKEGWGVGPVAGGLGRLGNYQAYGEKASLVLQRQLPQERLWLCVSFDSRDLIHLVNAPAHLAKAMCKAFGDRIEGCYQDFVSENFELRLKDAVWSQPTPKGAVQSRLIALQVLRCLHEQGYSLCASLDLDHGLGGTLYLSSGEIWFCCR
ncbi:hypothetical protein ASPZODRAFT_127856 [Penicilliopsis zonata CBS 506.65]|uniref:Uncharacterized protein n=1 Tax=Penicilliopsis zonata CBS 506.65 TaxID=1073090 RepID=A0A1L9SX45_9EURO|nr:hypothetical protein ASPZODRAFT_127856 [Penicilliopsis zonata CBS 506.65]OJJ51729.1 hypothetical protein ASPZODRAFT_127856 [Penicilliopsis zonata CBS 506.65]